MNLEMKSIKHFASGSQETYCYTAVVYLDGKPFADVSNDGHGGSDYVHPHDKSPLTKVQGAWRKKFDEIEEYFASLPKTDVGKYEWSPEGFDQKFEYWCAEQVTNFLYKKDMKKDMRRHHLVKLEDGLYQWRHEVAVWKIKRQHPEAIILNDLPEAEALAIFRAEVG